MGSKKLQQQAPRVIFLANQFIGKSLMSGGDTLAVEIIKRTKKTIVIIAPDSIRKTLSQSLSGYKYSFISSEKMNTRLASASTIIGGYQTVVAYFCRAYHSYKWMRKNLVSNDVIYLTGDFICNTLPAWFMKKNNRDVYVIANFFHRIPSPWRRQSNLFLVSFFSRALQTISLRLLEKIVGKYFVLSEVGRDELIKRGVERERIIVSGAGVQKSKILPFLSTVKRKNHLIYIGRINESKGAFDLVKILGSLKKLNPDFHCTMVGPGAKSDMDRLASLAKQEGVTDHLTVTGYVDEDTKYKLLASSCCLLLPSKEEGYGIVVQEALTLGVGAVCYDLPALRTLFGSSNLIKFVPCYSADDFCHTINCVLLDSGKSLGPSGADELQDWDDVYRIQAEHFDRIN
jgi:glycosyltransferase involved in cell wall biosynthesis